MNIGAMIAVQAAANTAVRTAVIQNQKQQKQQKEKSDKNNGGRK